MHSSPLVRVSVLFEDKLGAMYDLSSIVQFVRST